MKFVPERGAGKRFEIHRSRERIAHLVWRDLNDNLEDSVEFEGGPDATEPGSANFAVPGGTVHWGLQEDADSLSSSMQGVAFKPQFGEFPETLTIVGFYQYDIGTPYEEKMLIANGRTYTGPSAGAPSYSGNTRPTASTFNAARSLKDAIETAIANVPLSESAAAAAGQNYWAEIIALEIAGVRFGRGGLHFPT